MNRLSKNDFSELEWGEANPIEIPDAAPVGPAKVYGTKMGTVHFGDSLDLLKEPDFRSEIGKVQLAFTSPPFPLQKKKKYGNKNGDEYVEWFASYAPALRDCLSDDGSIVVEIGNVWERGEPVMSTDVIRAFLRFLEEGDLHLCQEFIWYNPARLPSPVEWVNKQRCRVKDAFTRVWWMSPTTRPKADNRKVLKTYSPSMQKLLKTGKYNPGKRPSEHKIGEDSFNRRHEGAIPPNVGGGECLSQLDRSITPKQFADYFESHTNLLKCANTHSNDRYRKFCKDRGADVHPARMPSSLVEFFVNFLTDEGDLVLDPFGGSNTTGEVAERLDRRWVSIEKNWQYAANSIGRFQPNDVEFVNRLIKTT